MSAHTVKLD